MSQFLEQYPIIATIFGFGLAIAAGAIDLVVLRNRALAIVFWLWGFPLAVTPIVMKESWGDIRWFAGFAIAVLYLISVVKVYVALVPGQPERPMAEDEED